MAKKLNIGEMLGAAVSNSDTMQVRDIPIKLIDGNKDNSYAMTAIDDLAESIEIAGLQQPLVVRPVGDRYLLLAGHRRKAALEQLGRTIAPCFVQDMELDPSMETLILHWKKVILKRRSTRLQGL